MSDTENDGAGGDARPLPLAGVRVLDVSQVMAGPFCTMMLADMGADVIKIEPPGGGDQTRSAMGFKLKGDDSLGFLNLNRNKRSLAINLKSEAGLAAFKRLAATADILVENYRPGVAKKLGIGYDDLAPSNPGLVYASISGFGQTGPWAGRPGFDLMAQAMAGVMSITGHPGEAPAKAGVPVADIGCALFALSAILAAHVGRRNTGQGQYIDASLYEAALAFAIWDVCEYWGTGRVPTKLGTANRMSAPYQAVRASDGYFCMGANSQRLWERLCALIERPDLAADPRFATIADRLANRAPMIEALEAVFVTRTAEEWVARLLDAGIPAAPIYDYAQALDNEHARARGVVMEIDHPIEGKARSLGFPMKMTGTPQQVRLPPPLLGEHTDAILAKLGFDAAARRAMEAQGAVGRGPRDDVESGPGT